MLVLSALLFAGVTLARNVDVTFNEPLNDKIVWEIEHILGRRVRHFVPPANLRLCLTDEEQRFLEYELTSLIVSITDVPIDELISPNIAHPRLSTNTRFGEMVTFNGTRIPRTQGAESSVDLDQRLTLIVLLDDSPHAEQSALALIDRAREHLSDLNATVTGDTMLVQNVPPSGEGLEEFIELLLTADETPVEWIQRYVRPEIQDLWTSSNAQRPYRISQTSHGDALAARNSMESFYPLWAAGLRGQGQLIGISDTGLETESCFFYDDSAAVPITYSKAVPPDTGHAKVRALWCSGDCTDHDGHGTHVSGIAVGRAHDQSGLGDSSFDAADFDGLAPDARVVFVDIQAGTGGLYPPFPYDSQLAQFYIDSGCFISSVSWGADDPQGYSEQRSVDLLMWDNPTFFWVSAAGNSGDSVGAASVLSPGLAKNSFTVGAFMNGVAPYELGNYPTYSDATYGAEWVADFSSRGGRDSSVEWLTVDIGAGGGAYVWSATASNNDGACAPVEDTLYGSAGTSQATPVVSAAAALTRQYFMDGFYGPVFEPTGALIGAVLIAGATPGAGVFPDQHYSTIASGPEYEPYREKYFEGFGRLDLARSLSLDTTPHTHTLVMANGARNSKVNATNDLRRYCTMVDGTGTADVTIALTWTDYPSPVSGRSTIINDLDLLVRVNDGPVLPVNDLTGRDSRSTRERVRLSDATLPLELEIEVRGTLIQFLSQSFALLVVAHGDDVELIDPVDPDTFPFVTYPGRCVAPSATSTTTLAEPATTAEPTPVPTTPTFAPSVAPTATPTATPTAQPTVQPTPLPTAPVTAPCQPYGVEIDSVCHCFVGSAGPQCTSCTVAPSGVTLLCVGLDKNRIPRSLQSYGNHTLLSVDSNTLSDRLDGSFYDQTTNKDADLIPGEGGLSCLCTPFNTDSVSSSLIALRNRESLSALALPEEFRVLSTPPPPPPQLNAAGAAFTALPLLFGITVNLLCGA